MTFVTRLANAGCFKQEYLFVSPMMKFRLVGLIDIEGVEGRGHFR